MNKIVKFIIIGSLLVIFLGVAFTSGYIYGEKKMKDKQVTVRVSTRYEFDEPFCNPEGITEDAHWACVGVMPLTFADEQSYNLYMQEVDRALRGGGYFTIVDTVRVDD